MQLLKLTLALLATTWAPSLFAVEGLQESPVQVVEEVEEVETAQNPPTERELAEQWAFDFMMAKVPPGTKIYYADGQETPEETEARYRSIARDIIEVVFDPKTKIPFRSAAARTKTAAVILGVMYHESSFMKHVDYGLGPHGRGDGGRSWCMMQLNIGDGRTRAWNTAKDRVVFWGDPEHEIAEGILGTVLVSDRKSCIREGLKLIRMSVECPDNPEPLMQLRAYVSGKCTEGDEKSRVRMGTAIRWFNETAKTRKFSDKGVMQEVAASQEKELEDRRHQEVETGILPDPDSV